MTNTVNEFLGFKTDLLVRIYDINYGRHVGHAELLRIVHQARLNFFDNFSLQEHDIEGACIVVRSSFIDFKHEALYGDLLNIYITIDNIKRASLEINYQVTKNNNTIHIASVNEVVLFMDYETRKVVSVPSIIHTIVKNTIGLSNPS